MIVIGLTGGIGMGKTTLASQFSALGAKVCSADAIVHVLLAADTSVIAAIKKHFPSAIKDGAVDRKALGKIVFGDDEKRRLLESILHPRVVAAENRFVEKQRRKGTKAVVLDIPLLFETGAESRCDVTVLASAPHFIQRQRVMKRPGMTEEKFSAIVNAQMPDAMKQRRADVIINTGQGKAASFRMVKQLMKKLHAA